jgi:hypothetical protein
MANWIYNYLAIHGDTDLITTIIRKHFQIEPDNPDPNKLEGICLFYGLTPHDENRGYKYGFDVGFGATRHQSTTSLLRRDVSISNPLHVFWCSKWNPSGFVPTTLAARYPGVRFEYEWYDAANDMGQSCVSDAGQMFVVSEANIPGNSGA